MYDKIVNPKTGRKVNINGKLGRQILRNYLDVLQGGAPNQLPNSAIESLSSPRAAQSGGYGGADEEADSRRAREVLNTRVKRAEAALNSFNECHTEFKKSPNHPCAGVVGLLKKRKCDAALQKCKVGNIWEDIDTGKIRTKLQMKMLKMDANTRLAADKTMNPDY